MKTQLLEDIGQSIEPFLVPSGKDISSLPNAAAAAVLPRSRARPSMPRSSTGVWRQKPADDVNAPGVQQPQRPPPEPETPKVFIKQGPAPESLHVPPAAPHEPAPAPIEPALGGHHISGGAVSPDPLFDLAPRSATAPEQEPKHSEASWFQRSGQRYLLWGSGVLLAMLAVQGGWWLYGARKDAGSLALVASEFKAEPQQGRTVKRRPIAAKEFTLGPDGEVRVSSAPTAASLRALPSATPAVPPLAVLQPEPAAGSKPELAPARTPGIAPRQALPEPEEVAKHTRRPIAERVRGAGQKQPAPREKPAVAQVERARDRGFDRPSVMQAARTSAHESTMAATLKACREHGYHAAQCIKRACSVTKYGFVCRGK